jgi:hypothetical protein
MTECQQHDLLSNISSEMNRYEFLSEKERNSNPLFTEKGQQKSENSLGFNLGNR